MHPPVRFLFVYALAALGIGMCSSACAASSAEDDEDGVSADAAFTEEDAACFDEEPRSGESKTEARARCLTAQATRLIDAQITRAEDPRDKQLTVFKGKLRVAAETGCFTEDVSGGVTGLWRNDIDSRRDVGMLGVELKAAVEFLKYYYRDLDGYPNHFFDTIEICPNGQVGGDLRLVGSRLRVGVRTGLGGRVGVHTSTVLREKWTSGEHLEDGNHGDGGGVLAQLKGERWSILDPVGTPRTALRKALRGILARLKDRLNAMQDKPDAQVRDELTRLVRDETSLVPDEPEGGGAGGGSGGDNSSIHDRALAKIAAMSGPELTRFAASWKAEIEKSELVDGTEESVVSMRDVLNHKNVSVKVSQRGFVNVQNYKQISVDTEIFLPGASTFRRYVETSKTETTIAVEQFGFVNIQLNDVITVRVQIVYGKVAQTASLDRALPSR